MPESIYILVGYPQYEFIDKICYRKRYVTSSKAYQYQCRKKRKIKISKKGRKGEEQKGYWLVKGCSRKFIPLTKLHHKLKKIQ